MDESLFDRMVVVPKVERDQYITIDDLSLGIAEGMTEDNKGRKILSFQLFPGTDKEQTIYFSEMTTKSITIFLGMFAKELGLLD